MLEKSRSLSRFQISGGCRFWSEFSKGFLKDLKGFYCEKHNAGLNMRHKHGNQTITAALEGQSNTL